MASVKWTHEEELELLNKLRKEIFYSNDNRVRKKRIKNVKVLIRKFKLFSSSDNEKSKEVRNYLWTTEREEKDLINESEKELIKIKKRYEIQKKRKFAIRKIEKLWKEKSKNSEGKINGKTLDEVLEINGEPWKKVINENYEEEAIKRRLTLYLSLIRDEAETGDELKSEIEKMI